LARSLEDEVRALAPSSACSARSTWAAPRSAPGSTRRRLLARACTRISARSVGSRSRSLQDLVEATQDTQAFVLYSSCLKSLAIKLSKVCNDLRLLLVGPARGLREINLPAKQPGSSIMPGKVNPVIPRSSTMVCYRVIGSDLTVSMAAEAGQLQLNVFEPVIAACIFEAQTALHERGEDAARALHRRHQGEREGVPRVRRAHRSAS
jgi:aspartate ammonia-lyase